MPNTIVKEAAQALLAFKSKGPFQVTPISVGWINHTFLVDGKFGKYVLQKLHPVFKPEVNLDFQAVTCELNKNHLLEPQLILTDQDELWTMLGNDCWRMQTFMEGTTYVTVKEEKIAFEIGRLTGKFHAVLQDFSYDYKCVRPNVHNTKSFFKEVADLVENSTEHPHYADFFPLASKLLKEKDQLADFYKLPLHNSHGDLKISNFLFDDQNQAICLLDLDTLGRMPWPLEMGDAFRSWCNLKAEDDSTSQFSENIFKASLQGYCEQAKFFWTPLEKDMLLVGIKTIALELSARFLIDVINDRYWGWDSDNYSSRKEHNLARAQGQWSLYLDIVKKSASLTKIINEAFQ